MHYGKLVRSRTAGAFAITESIFDGGPTLPTHSHDLPYFTFTLRGAYRERYGKRLRWCTPGTAVAHPADEAHSQKFAREPALLLRVALREIDDDYTGELRAPLTMKNPAASRAVWHLHDELEQWDDASELIAESIAHELVARALLQGCSRGGSRRRALSARALLRASLRSSVSLGELARAAGVSRATLYRDFKSSFGMSPGDYLRVERLRAARTALQTTAKPIGEIAIECGFYDQSHLDRAFRRAMGSTPLEFRRRD